MSNAQETIRPATSKDVAALAGVSRATVSRILNGDDAPFPQITRERVHDAAAKLRYRPSAAARSLVRGQSETIVIVAPDTRFGGHLQDSVDEVVAQTHSFAGNVVVRVASMTSKATVEALIGLRPFAVLNFGVLSDADIEGLSQRGIIVVPRLSSGRPQSPGIAHLQASALFARGPRPLWYATPAVDDRPEPYSEARLMELQEFCVDGGHPLPRAIPVTLTIDGGAKAVEQLFNGEATAAVACYNDEVAMALLAGARRFGIAVPERLSVAGVDDSIAGQLWAPRLTTIHVDMHAFISDLISELRTRISDEPAVVAQRARQMFTLVSGETV